MITSVYNGDFIIGISDNGSQCHFSMPSAYVILDPEQHLKFLYKKILEGYKANNRILGAGFIQGLYNIEEVEKGHQKISDKIKEYIALSAQIEKDKDKKPKYFYIDASMTRHKFHYEDDKYVYGISHLGSVTGSVFKVVKNRVKCFDHGLEELRKKQWEEVIKHGCNQDVLISVLSCIKHDNSLSTWQISEAKVICKELGALFEFYLNIEKAIKELEDG
jgi:hypothetical protein